MPVLNGHAPLTAGEIAGGRVAVLTASWHTHSDASGAYQACDALRHVGRCRLRRRACCSEHHAAASICRPTGPRRASRGTAPTALGERARRGRPAAALRCRWRLCGADRRRCGSVPVRNQATTASRSALRDHRRAWGWHMGESVAAGRGNGSRAPDNGAERNLGRWAPAAALRRLADLERLRRQRGRLEDRALVRHELDLHPPRARLLELVGEAVPGLGALGEA